MNEEWEEPPLNQYQVKYLNYLDRRREFANKHRYESSPFSFETFEKMLDDYHLEETTAKTRQAIEKLLFAEQESGLLWIH